MPIQKITSGIIDGTTTFANTAISGTITASQIATVNANTITSGTIPVAQVPQLTTAKMPTGSVLQAVQGTLSSNFSTTSNSFTPIGANVSITPVSSSSRILLMASVGVGVSASNYVDMSIFRDSTNLAGAYGFITTFSSDPTLSACQNFSHIDSPATTSAITYSIRMRSQSSITYAVVGGSGQICTLIAMEIAG